MMNANRLPLVSAKWIWPGSSMYLINHFAHFRKDFELSTIPKVAPFFITADQAYRLYINGKYICRGPARGYQAHWPYDQIDVAQYLQKGHNWIAVEAYNPGISTFRYIHQACAGFICAAEWDEFKLYSDESWQKRRSDANRIDTARYSLQLDFQEHIDAGKADRNWIYSETPPADWTINWTSPLEYLDSFAFGRSPYFSVEERGIPMLREYIIAPEKIIGVGSGKSKKDYRNWKNIAWTFAEECKNVKYLPNIDLDEKNTGNYLELMIPPAVKGEFTAMVIRMPEYTVGSVNIKITADKKMDGGIIDFLFSEQFKDDKPLISTHGKMSEGAFGNRMFLAGTDIDHEFFHIHGFRFITLVARDITEIISLKLNVRIAEYPFSMKGDFDSSDQVINNIYRICRKTQQICSLDAYVDTPGREQAQWWGDARIQGKNTFYLDGATDLFKRGIRSISAQSTPNGLTFGHAPTCAHNCILPDFSLTWIMTIWDYYWQTGDITLFEEQWPRIQRVLDYFETPQARDSSGLLLHDTRFWYFGDWAKLYKGDGIPTLLNLYYLQVMEKISAMLQIVQKESSAAFADKTSNFRKLLINKLYDPKIKLFRDGIELDGSPVKRYSVHEQTMAVLLGLKPDFESNAIEQRLLPFIRQKQTEEFTIPSPFWATYTFEALNQKGYGADVIRFIKEKWSPMLETGTTWESYTSGGSVSHAWTAHPSYHFVNILTGITQIAPGWQRIQINPLVLKQHKHASTLIPAPQGNISIRWKKTKKETIDLSIDLPQNIKAEIIFSKYNEIIAGPGYFEMKDIVI